MFLSGSSVVNNTFFSMLQPAKARSPIIHKIPDIYTDTNTVFGFMYFGTVPDRVFDRTATNLVYTLPAMTITEQ